MRKLFILFDIYLNNGWRRVDSLRGQDKDRSYFMLPRPGIYDLVDRDNEIIYRYFYRGSIICDHFIKNRITHFRKSKSHFLPKF